jgi:hypothetical protein
MMCCSRLGANARLQDLRYPADAVGVVSAMAA